MIKFILACHLPLPPVSGQISSRWWRGPIPGETCAFFHWGFLTYFPVAPLSGPTVLCYTAKNLLSHLAGLHFPIFLRRSEVTREEGSRRPICLRVPKDNCLTQVPFKKKDSQREVFTDIHSDSKANRCELHPTLSLPLLGTCYMAKLKCARGGHGGAG